MAPSEVYNPERTYVVQQNPQTGNGNILVRGNIPLNGSGGFAYDELNGRLQQLVQLDPDPALFNLENYELIVVPLIDNQGERPELQDEFTAFGAGSPPTAWPPFANNVNIFRHYGTTVCGQSGNLMWMPVQGCTDPANCALVEPSDYDFSGIVDQLNTLMTTLDNTVIYYHCMNGHDRTGSLTACFMMKYMGRTRDQAMNDKPPEGADAMGHPWHPPYAQLIEWYASTIGK